MEAVQFFSGFAQGGATPQVYGVDKNPRMLLLAEHNLGHQSGFLFRERLRGFTSWCRRARCFPAWLGSKHGRCHSYKPAIRCECYSRYRVCLICLVARRWLNLLQDRVPSEVLFVDLCLRLLRPGGCLAIVLPRSVITNEGLARQRQAIDRLGHLTDIIDLPAETFASTGTQTTTVAAFFRKHAERSQEESVSVRVCHVTNVGVDSTGRHREGNQLPNLAARISDGEAVGEPAVLVYRNVPVREVLQRCS